jgi:hypothetical protein
MFKLLRFRLEESFFHTSLCLYKIIDVPLSHPIKVSAFLMR